MMIRNIVGPPARGKDFYDREDLVALIWDRLEAGNVLLAAPRRFGKTSIMYCLIDQPKGGWKPVHVDAESIREPVNFVIALLDALLSDRHLHNFLVSSWKSASKWLRSLVDGIELTTPWDVDMKIKLKEKIQPNWQDQGEALLRTLRKYDANEKPLIIIDELPVMLDLFRDNDVNEADTRAFLYWFRKLRTDPDIGLTNCRFLIGGSVGIEHYLSDLNAVPSFNDFERVNVAELDPKQTADFLKQLLQSRKVKLTKATQKQILALIGVPIPYFIQIFVSEIASELVRAPGPVGSKRLEDIYQHRVLGATCKTYFQDYYDRLRRYHKPDEQAAKAVLKELALAHPHAVNKAQLLAIYRKTQTESATQEGFSRLMGDLENDFYIRYHPEDDGYRFICKILCDWWRRHYAF